MTGTGSRFKRGIARLLAAASLLAAFSACGTVDRVRGPKEGAATELEARSVAPQDPLARPIQVAWTSARASHCGFVFNPDQLRSNFLAAEARTGASPDQMQKVERAYDYTLQSVAATIKDNLNYCNNDRTAAIRRDLNRYLSGDYTPSARMAQ
ncbi:MAG TPA: hypothetical protein VJT12_08495, partial [Methyloceanibacter sp.]|nr:hypothetical protein [Methyloceanibacter sp.]